MIPIQATWIDRHYGSFKFNENHTDPLLQNLGSNFFCFKSQDREIDLPQELQHPIMEYLSVLDIHLLGRINKNFQASISQFIRSVFKRQNCMDFSGATDTQLITYHLQQGIDPLLLKIFGRALVEAPFLGRFENTDSIPSHEGHSIARGLVAIHLGSTNRHAAGVPFISFYVGRKDTRNFTASSEKTYDNKRWRVQTGTPAINFIYVHKLHGSVLFPLNCAESLYYLPEQHADRNIVRLGGLDIGFGNRWSAWRSEDLILISQIFENLDDNFIPFTGPIRESISIEEIED